MNLSPRGRDGRPPRERRLWDQELYVGNLPHIVTKEHIERLFVKYSPTKVERVQRGMKCFAFLDLGDSETVARAIRDLNNSTYEGRRLVVRHVKQYLDTLEQCEDEDVQCEEASAETDAECNDKRSEPNPGHHQTKTECRRRNSQIYVKNLPHNIAKDEYVQCEEASSETETELNEERSEPGLAHNQEIKECRRRNSRIYVGNLPHNITKDNIEHLFVKYSPKQLERVQIGKKCFAFLDLGNSETVALAIKELNNSTYEGRRLIVRVMKRNYIADDFKSAVKEYVCEDLQCEEASAEVINSKDGIDQDPSPSQAIDSTGDMSDSRSMNSQCLQCQTESRSQEQVYMKSILVQQSRNLKLEETKLLLEIEKLQLEIKKLTRENSFFTCRA